MKILKAIAVIFTFNNAIGYTLCFQTSQSLMPSPKTSTANQSGPQNAFQHVVATRQCLCVCHFPVASLCFCLGKDACLTVEAVLTWKGREEEQAWFYIVNPVV